MPATPRPLLLGLFLAPCLAGVGPWAVAQERPAQAASKPFMPLEPARLERWARQRDKAALAVPLASSGLETLTRQPAQAAGSSFSLLADISTQGVLRDQGSNGNCWVWASSALAEVALRKTYGWADSLSVQYVDSLIAPADWASGGTLTEYCDDVNRPGLLVPWVNANAAYVDGMVALGQSLTPTASIQLAPAYTHVYAQPRGVATRMVSQATAIANIKDLLNHHQAVSFSFWCNMSGAAGFIPWWNGNPETAVWQEPVTGPKDSPDNGGWGGHMVVVVGYDETDPLPANHCWILLNSWGIPAGRSQGLFRMPMAMNYESTFSSGGHSYPNYVFEALDVGADHPDPRIPGLSTARSSGPVLLGQPLTFSVVPDGYPPYRYQWFRNNQAIPGATSTTYSVDYLHASDAGQQYAVQVSNEVAGAVVNTVSPVLVVPAMPGQQQLLGNAQFDDGSDPAPWILSAKAGSLEPGQGRSGSSDLILGDVSGGALRGSLDQTVQLPSGPGSVLLSFWQQPKVGGFWSSGSGHLRLTVLDAASGASLQVVEDTSQIHGYPVWIQHRFGLTELKGRTVTLHAEFNTSTAGFRLDDCALVVDPLGNEALPVIAGFSPAMGNPGDLVKLQGSGFTGTQTVRLNGSACVFTVDSDNQITVTVPNLDAVTGVAVGTGPWFVNTVVGSGASSGSFRVLRPAITSFAPSSVLRGGTVILTGYGFTDTLSVVCDGLAGTGTVAVPFTVVSDNQVALVIPAGAITGGITLTNPYGEARVMGWLRILPSGPVTVSISPRPLAVVAGSTWLFTGTVHGDIDTTVDWYMTAPNLGSLSSVAPTLKCSLAPGVSGTLRLSLVWVNDPAVMDSLDIPVKTLNFLANGTVSVLDLLPLAAGYGAQAGQADFNPALDLDGDGVIGDADLALFKANF